MLSRKQQIELGKAINKQDWTEVIKTLKSDGYDNNSIYVTLKKYGLSKEDVEYYAT